MEPTHCLIVLRVFLPLYCSGAYHPSTPWWLKLHCLHSLCVIQSVALPYGHTHIRNGKIRRKPNIALCCNHHYIDTTIHVFYHVSLIHLAVRVARAVWPQFKVKWGVSQGHRNSPTWHAQIRHAAATTTRDSVSQSHPHSSNANTRLQFVKVGESYSSDKKTEQNTMLLGMTGQDSNAAYQKMLYVSTHSLRLLSVHCLVMLLLISYYVISK